MTQAFWINVNESMVAAQISHLIKYEYFHSKNVTHFNLTDFQEFCETCCFKDIEKGIPQFNEL